MVPNFMCAWSYNDNKGCDLTKWTAHISDKVSNDGRLVTVQLHGTDGFHVSKDTKDLDGLEWLCIARS